MSKKPKVKSPAFEPFERPATFPIYQTEPLGLDERQWFREVVAHPVFKKVMRNAYAKRPPSFVISNPAEVPNPEVMQLRDAKRLAQIQGWELFEAAFFQQLDPPVTKSFKVPEETYVATEPEKQ